MARAVKEIDIYFNSEISKIHSNLKQNNHELNSFKNLIKELITSRTDKNTVEKLKSLYTPPPISEPLTRYFNLLNPQRKPQSKTD